MVTILPLHDECMVVEYEKHNFHVCHDGRSRISFHERFRVTLVDCRVIQVVIERDQFDAAPWYVQRVLSSMITLKQFLDDDASSIPNHVTENGNRWFVLDQGRT